MTEGIVLAAVLRAGYRPLLPFGDGARYDIALDGNGKLMRVQCKTGRLQKGAIYFPTTSWHGNKHRAYGDEVDFFGVYCPGTGEVYLVPQGDVPQQGASLRVEPPRNNQAKGVRWAEAYVIPAHLAVGTVLTSRLPGFGEARIPRRRWLCPSRGCTAKSTDRMVV